MIIGLTGPICSGTDSVARILEEKGFTWFSYSDLLREELARRGVGITRTGLQDLGDELRKERGLGVLSEMIIEKMEQGGNYVVNDLRNPGEVEVFREKFGKDFVLILVDAPLNVRFKRMVERNRESDPDTLEGFRKLEERDLGLNEANYRQQHAAVFKMADFTIENDSGFEDLKGKVEGLLENLK